MESIRLLILLGSAALGAVVEREPHGLSLAEWSAFLTARHAGVIDGRRRLVAKDKRVPVGVRTVEADAVWLRQLLGWATKWRDETGRYLLRLNPLQGREFTEKIRHEENPRRPLATDDRYDAVRAVAGRVHRLLPAILALAHGTGRRIGAILALTHEDVLWGKGEQRPYRRIRWRAEEDKIGKEWVAPMSVEVRAALETLPRAIGLVPLFPGTAYDRVARWLRRAERLAGVPKQSGSLWHAYRRGWATARKHLSGKDVAFAGGWKNVATLQTIYQQPDPESTYRAVAEPLALREARA